MLYVLPLCWLKQVEPFLKVSPWWGAFPLAAAAVFPPSPTKKFLSLTAHPLRPHSIWPDMFIGSSLDFIGLTLHVLYFSPSFGCHVPAERWSFYNNLEWNLQGLVLTLWSRYVVSLFGGINVHHLLYRLITQLNPVITTSVYTTPRL
jgi:hypothetical protein